MGAISAIADYLFSGAMVLITDKNHVFVAASTGLRLTLAVAGSLPRKLSPFNFFDGLMGIGTKPPPQLGQTLPKTISTHSAQNVHSKLKNTCLKRVGRQGFIAVFAGRSKFKHDPSWRELSPVSSLGWRHRS